MVDPPQAARRGEMAPPPKTRRCKFYLDSGEAVGKGCFRASDVCPFAHPGDPQWDSAESTAWLREKEQEMNRIVSSEEEVKSKLQALEAERGQLQEELGAEPIATRSVQAPAGLPPPASSSISPPSQQQRPSLTLSTTAMKSAAPPSVSSPWTHSPHVMYNKAMDPRLAKRDSVSAASAPRALVSPAIAAPSPISTPSTQALSAISPPATSTSFSAISPPNSASLPGSFPSSASVPPQTHSPSILGPAFAFQRLDAHPLPPASASAPPATRAYHASPPHASPRIPQSPAFHLSPQNPLATSPPNQSKLATSPNHPPPSPFPFQHSPPHHQSKSTPNHPLQPHSSNKDIPHPSPHGSPRHDAHTEAPEPERPARPPVPPATEEQRAVWRERVRLMRNAIIKQTAYHESDTILSESRDKLHKLQSSPSLPILLSQLTDLEEQRDKAKSEADAAYDALLRAIASTSINSVFGDKVKVPSEEEVEMEVKVEEQRREMVGVARELGRVGEILRRAVALLYERRPGGIEKGVLEELRGLLRKEEGEEGSEVEIVDGEGEGEGGKKEDADVVMLPVEEQEQEQEQDDDIQLISPPQKVLPLPKRSQVLARVASGSQSGSVTSTPAGPSSWDMDGVSVPPATPALDSDRHSSSTPKPYDAEQPTPTPQNAPPPPTPRAPPAQEHEYDQAISTIQDIEYRLSDYRNTLDQHDAEYNDMQRLEGVMEEVFKELEGDGWFEEHFGSASQRAMDVDWDEEEEEGEEREGGELEEVKAEVEELGNDVGFLADTVGDALKHMNDMQSALNGMRKVEAVEWRGKVEKARENLLSIEQSYAQTHTTLSTLQRAVEAYARSSPSPSPSTSRPATPLPTQQDILKHIPGIVDAFLLPKVNEIRDVARGENVWEARSRELGRVWGLVDVVHAVVGREGGGVREEEERERKRVRV